MNNDYCHTLLFAFALLWGTSSIVAQSHPVSGLLADQETQTPLPYATAVFFQLPDSTTAGSSLTQDDGRFELSLPKGQYYAVFQYVGYADKTLEGITIDGPAALGVIGMRPDAIALQEIEVAAERSQMELKLDRRVFNVGKDLTNAGNSAADILDKVPAVNVDPEGNISLRGSQSVRILVNGKPSGLMSAGETEALMRMQGDIIERVEVITNPSARYEAEGEAGIINIILKKNKEKGVNGSFGLTAGYPQNFGGSYSLNYRQEDLNFFSNFGIDYRKSPGGGTSEQRFFDGGLLSSAFNSETERLRGGLGGYLQLGSDWYLSPGATLTGSVLYRTGEDVTDASIVYQDLDASLNPILTTRRETEEEERDHNFETALNFNKVFGGDEGHSWTIDFKYILDDDTELAGYRQSSSDQSAPLIQRSRNTEDEANILLQTDYIRPLGESSKVEAGLRAALRTVNNDFLVEEEAAGAFEPLPEFNDALEYTENIYAAYLIGGHEFGAFGLQAGLRAELSDITAALLRSGVSNDQDYLSLFPSASLSYKISGKDQVQLSYSRRLSRPYFRRLLPFSNYNDPRNNNIGNPNLRPEFTHAFEAGFLKYMDKGSFLSGIYYRRTTGVIERLTLPAEDGTTIIYPVNLAERDAYGVELNFSYNFTEQWDITSDLNFYRALVNGSFEGQDYSADIFSWDGQIASKVKIGEAWKAQASFDYRAPRNTPQGRRLSIYMLDLALSFDTFEGRGTFTLTGRDLFNTRKRRVIVDLPDYQAESVFQWRQTRSVVLTFNYRLKEK
ncbi:outer membrane beta-barrel family protein [Phaeodactylibacter luteus]|uniref:TonB-dependent receptor n=1 Tax=Phaeodactylibacter luteus TaxID=1564516 RepID=A0A5C6RII9_9BACT|nr:outer membrane beta-barrel family protein [Phaeodactylibacter luteus]TXB62248.1 TonB-dependent receptor [Phaeodactylibacter luteus]